MTLKRADPRPVYVTGGRVGALVLHGFTGAPAEVRPIAERLVAAGHTVCAPLLPGHGTSAADLRRTHRNRWREAVREAWSWLSERTDQRVIAGLSMGSLLGLELAARHPHGLAGVVAMAPAIRVRDPRLPLSLLGRHLLDYVAAPRESGLVDPEGINRLWHYDVRPVAAAAQLYLLMREVRREVTEISAPLLILQGTQDRSVPIEAAHELLRMVSSVDRELILLERSGHCLPVDAERDHVASLVEQFVARVTG